MLKFNTTLANLKDVKNHFLLSKFGTLEMHLFYVRKSNKLWRGGTTRKQQVPNCQKPSGYTRKPSGIIFLTANRQDFANGSSISGKVSSPVGWPTEIYS